jgi:hypothetical protein
MPSPPFVLADPPAVVAAQRHSSSSTSDPPAASGAADTLPSVSLGQDAIAGYRALRVRRGMLKRPAGYQPDVVVLVSWESPVVADAVRCMTVNTAYGL